MLAALGICSNISEAGGSSRGYLEMVSLGGGILKCCVQLRSEGFWQGYESLGDDRQRRTDDLIAPGVSGHD
jgi:hypothetical protein